MAKLLFEEEENSARKCEFKETLYFYNDIHCPAHSRVQKDVLLIEDSGLRRLG